MFGIRAVGISRLTSIAAAVAAYTKSLILSLKGDSAYNKNQNTTILDRSTNDLAVTRGGDAAQTVSSFSPFSSTASYYFDGSGDYLSVPTTAVDIGTSDFTIEAWVFHTGGTDDTIYSNSGSFTLTYGASGYLRFYIGAGNNIIDASVVFLSNQWVHVAVSRSSGTLRLFQNGVQVASSTSYPSIGNSSATSYIGKYYGGTIQDWTGYISNLRIVKGTALYTAAFTPPTAALTAVSGTSLLTCHSGRLFDASSAAADISVAGNTSASTFSPFSPTALSGTVGGSSVFFNGSTDSLSAPATAAVASGSSFTIETWIYLTGYSAAYNGNYRGMIVSSLPSAGTTGFELMVLGTASSWTGLTLNYKPGNAGASANFNFALNSWYHVALVKNGSTWTYYVNGTALTTTVTTSTWTDSGTAVSIGKGLVSTWESYFKGHMSNLRIVKGTAVYTAAFTPSTTDLTAVSGTSLLTCQGNTISDNSSNNATITVSGNSRRSSLNPFGSGGGWSAYFDGVGDYLTASASASPSGLEDFTIEFWYYAQAKPTAYPSIWTSGGTYSASSSLGIYDRHNGSPTVFRAEGANTAVAGSTVVQNNVWYHIAVTRQNVGGIYTMRLFVNGVLDGSSAAASGSLTPAACYFGRGDDASWAAGYTDINGYISNARIVKGTALYTSNFTPSTTALTAVSGTSLLTLQDNTFKDKSSNAFTVTPAGNTAIRAVGPFSSSSVFSKSMYFDGTGDYLTIPASAATNPLGADFTIEFWFKPISFGATNFLITQDSGGLAGNFVLACDSSGIVTYQSWMLSSRDWYWSMSSQRALKLGAWNHIAVTQVKSTSTTRIFLNGVLEATSVNGTWSGSSYATVLGNTAGGTTRAPLSTPSAVLNGYMSEVRLVTGTALYTTAFTPPSLPPAATAGTALLLNFIGSSIVDSSSNAFVISKTGDVAVIDNTGPFSSSSVFPGSIYFDGANDYLTIPSSAAMNLLGGDFTIECWFNPTTLNASGYNLLISQNTGASGSDISNFQLETTSTGLVRFYSWSTSATSSIWSIISTKTVKLGAWNHIAVSHVRSTNTTRLFLNGTIEATGTVATWAGTALQTCLGNHSAGAYQTTTYAKLNGYLSGVRLIKGTAAYTTAFTPPASPPAVTADTALLLNFNDGAVVDPIGSSSAGVLNTVGNVSTNTVTKKFGTGSLYFDGTGDYITMAGQPEYAFGTGDFTIECWVNTTNFSSTRCLYDSRPAADGAYITLYLETDGTVNLWVSGAKRITTKVTLANTWVHVALVRSSGTTRIYLDGIQSGSSYTDSTSYLNPAARPVVGGGGTLATQQFLGYMDDMRVYRGLAKYTSTFLPSENESTVASPSSFSWSMAGGASDGLTAASTSALALGTGDFTMEAWVYINTNVADYCGVLSVSTASTGAAGIRFGNVGFGYKLQVFVNSTSTDTCWSCAVTQTSILGAWTHIAFTRQSGVCRLFVNGVVQSINSGANPSTYPYTSFTDTTNVGNASLGVGTVLNAYITDARIIKGTALYTTSFTPPTATLAAVSGTTLLTGGGSTLVDSSSTAAAITTVGTPTVSSTNPFGAGNGWSVSFDGSSYFSVPRDCVQFGTGDFTMESWIYPTSTAEMSIFNRTWSGSNFLLCYISGGAISFWVGHALAGSVTLSSAATAIKTNQWQHIALTRRGTAVNIWVDGVSVAAGTCAVNLTNADTTPLLIGRYIPSGVPFSGYISNVRIVNGTAVYTTSFTPPTAKLTAVSGTAVLTAQNATAVDNSSNALTITAGGNARATTTYYKY